IQKFKLCSGALGQAHCDTAVSRTESRNGTGRGSKQGRRPITTIGGRNMTKKLARHCTALLALAGLGLAGPAFAQDKTVKIGVLNDMTSLYADIGGPSSVIAIKMAGDESGLASTGWKIEVLSGDHQNKPDVG